jgi:hypothetical protein
LVNKYYCKWFICYPAKVHYKLYKVKALSNLHLHTPQYKERGFGNMLSKIEKGKGT